MRVCLLACPVLGNTQSFYITRIARNEFLNMLPPPSNKYYRQLLLFVELISPGLPENLHMVTGKNFWGINSMGLPESLARSQHSVRRCELVTNKDYQKYGNAITGKDTRRIDLEQLRF